MAKKLLLTFADANDKKMSIGIDDPKDEITKEDIKNVMDTVIAKNIFNIKGSKLVKVVGAKIIKTTETEFDYKV